MTDGELTFAFRHCEDYEVQCSTAEVSEAFHFDTAGRPTGETPRLFKVYAPCSHHRHRLVPLSTNLKEFTLYTCTEQGLKKRPLLHVVIEGNLRLDQSPPQEFHDAIEEFVRQNRRPAQERTRTSWIQRALTRLGL
jgi:hypothetical protein